MLRLLIIVVFLQCSFFAMAMDTLRLNIDSVAMSELTQMRNSAMQTGLILKSHKKKVSAVFSSGSSELKAKIRLKGDWLDHVDTEKWSLRVELKNGHYKGMQRFSIQHPRTRGYLTEYEIHRLLDLHGVMTTNYDFAVVFINGENKGVYAVEEHFDFPMLDRLEHREAPIFKFDESVFWEFQRMQIGDWEAINVEYPVFENATITTFRKKKIRESDVLTGQFKVGRNLIHALRTDGYEKLSDLMDLNSFASLYAICDAVGLHHGLIWHNLRFYLDPVLNKLKPIAFDMWEAKSSLNRPFMGVQLERTDTIYFSDIFYRDKFLNDLEFRSIYFEKLKEFSNSTFPFNAIFKSDSNIAKYREAMMVEFPEANLGGFSLNQSILMDLDSVENAFHPFEYYSYWDWKKNNPDKVYARPMPEQPIRGLGLKAFRESIKGGKQRLKIINRHISTLELVGFSSKSRTQESVAQISPFLNDPSAYLAIEVDTSFTKIAFRVPGDTVIHETKISEYSFIQENDSP